MHRIPLQDAYEIVVFYNENPFVCKTATALGFKKSSKHCIPYLLGIPLHYLDANYTAISRLPLPYNHYVVM